MVKRIFTILLLALLSFHLDAQVLDTIFNGYLSPLIDTAGSAPTWHFKAQFVNEGKTFTGVTVTNASKILVAQGGRCYELDIDSVGYINGLIRGTVTDPSGTLTNLNVGGNIRFGAIVTPTPTRQLYPYVSGLPEVLQSCIETKNKLLIDTISSTGFAALSITDTTVTASSYSVSLSGQEERVVADVTTNNITITLPDTDVSLLGKKITVSQINSTTKSTLINVNGIGNKILPPGNDILSANITIPVGAKAQYIFTLAYDDNSGVYIWEATNPDVVYSELDGLKFFDQVTSTEQAVKVDYDYPSKASVLSASAPTNALIRVGSGLLYKVQDAAVSGYATDSSAVIPLANSKFAVIQPYNEVISSKAFKNFGNAVEYCQEQKHRLLVDSTIELTVNVECDSAIVQVEKTGRISLNGFSMTFGRAASLSNPGKSLFIAGDYQAFDLVDTSGIKFYPGSTKAVNPKWWGATGDCNGSVALSNGDLSPYYDNSTAFDAANRAITFNGGGGNIYLPAGNYRLTRPWIVGGDALFFSEISVYGDDSGKGFSSKTGITADFTTGACVSMNGMRDGSISKLSIIGKNQSHIAGEAYNSNINEWFGGFNSTAQQWYTGIATDYTVGARRISGLDITDCVIQGFNVGIALSLDGEVQGDNIKISRNYIIYNTIGIGIGEDQVRNVVVEDNVFVFLHTVFTNRGIGSAAFQGESFFYIRGNMVATCYQLFNATTDTNGNLGIYSMYAEDCGIIGNLSSSNAQNFEPIVFENCSFVQMKTWEDSYIFMENRFQPVTFDGCHINLNNEAYGYDQTMLIGGVTENSPVRFEDCRISDQTYNDPITIMSILGTTRGITIDSKTKFGPSNVYAPSQVNTNSTANAQAILVQKDMFSGRVLTTADKKTYEYIESDIIGNSVSAGTWGSNYVWDNDTLKVQGAISGCCYFIGAVGDYLAVGVGGLDTARFVYTSVEFVDAAVDTVKYKLRALDISNIGTDFTGQTVSIIPRKIMRTSVKKVTGIYRAIGSFNAFTGVADPGQFQVGDFLHVEGYNLAYTYKPRVKEISNDTIYIYNTIDAALPYGDTVYIRKAYGYWKLVSDNVLPFSSDYLTPDSKNRLRSNREFRFGNYGNDSDYTRANQNLVKGSHPYPTFSSTGVITNEASLPATDVTTTGLDSSTVQGQLQDHEYRMDSLEFPARASVYISSSDPDTITVTTGGAYEDFTDLTEGAKTRNFTVNTTTGRLTYIGTEPIVGDVLWTATITSNGTNENLLGIVETNAGVTYIGWEEEDIAASDRHSVAGSGELSLVTNDWVQPRITSQSNGTVVEIIMMNFRIIEAE